MSASATRRALFAVAGAALLATPALAAGAAQIHNADLFHLVDEYVAATHALNASTFDDWREAPAVKRWEGMCSELERRIHALPHTQDNIAIRLRFLRAIYGDKLDEVAEFLLPCRTSTDHRLVGEIVLSLMGNA